MNNAECQSKGHIGYMAALNATPYKAWQTVPSAIRCESCGAHVKVKKCSDFVPPTFKPTGASHQVDQGHYY